MADSPASDDSVVTVVNREQQQKDDEEYRKLQDRRREALTQHYKLVIDTMTKLVNYSEKWHSTDDPQKKKEIGATSVLETLQTYLDEVDKISKKHHDAFNKDNPLIKYFDKCSDYIQKTYKEVDGNIEPGNTANIQKGLERFRERYGKPIQDEVGQGDNEFKTPDFLTRVVEYKYTNEKRERQRIILDEKKGEIQKKVFEKYQQEILKDHGTQVALLEGFYKEGMAQLDPNFNLRLKVLRDCFQENFEDCHSVRTILRDNYFKQCGESEFYFLNPLEYHVKPGSERLENLGFRGPNVSEPEMRRILEKAMDKLTEEGKRLSRLTYKPVKVGDRS